MNGRTVSLLAVLIALPVLIVLAGSSFLSFQRSAPAVAGSTTIETEHDERQNLRSFFNDREPYDSAFSKVGDVVISEAVAGIVPHHFLARDLIARFYAGMADGSVKRVIVVGPDHFHVLHDGGYDAVTTGRSWDTPYGTMDSDTETIAKLGDVGIPEYDEVFLNEHSVYTEVPFIRKVFPNARIVPIVVNGTGGYDALIGIGKELKDMSSAKTVLIVSSDFSHEATAEEAKRSDDVSVSHLRDLRKGGLDGIRCDCRACMAVMLGFLGKDGMPSFRLEESRNSADFGGTGTTVTSYVSGYYLAR